MTNENTNRNNKGLSGDQNTGSGNNRTGFQGGGRGSNLTADDRSRGGRQSAQSQERDDQGQFVGRSSSSSSLGSSSRGMSSDDASATNIGSSGSDSGWSQDDAKSSGTGTSSSMGDSRNADEDEE